MNIRQTSINCYHQIKLDGLLSKRRFEVYEALYLLGKPSTVQEIFATLNHKRLQQARLFELRELGVVYEKSVRECTVTHKMVIEWDLTDNLPSGKIKKQVLDRPAGFNKSIKYLLSLMQERKVVYMHKVNLEELIHE